MGALRRGILSPVAWLRQVWRDYQSGRRHRLGNERAAKRLHAIATQREQERRRG